MISNGASQNCIYEKFSVQKAGALFMKMGYRKIDVTFAIIQSCAEKFDFVVWIAPANFLASNDYVKIIKFLAGGLYRKICFFSIEAISLSDSKYLQLYNLIDKYRTFCVVDESITIKNTEAGRTKRLLLVRSKFKFRLILSGTPITQGLIDLYSQIEFISPGILKMSESQFSNSFLPFYEDSYKTWRRWSRPEDEQLLVKLMLPYVYECDLDMDYNISYFDEYFTLTPEEELDYKAEKEAFLSNKYDDNRRIFFLEVVQKFQHIYTLCESKAARLFNLVNQIISENEKVIIYIKFLDEIIFLRECGGLGKHKSISMVGRTNKQKALALFEENINIMFCSYGVGAMELDLHFCNNIIYFSQTFDYKGKIQSMYNIYRVNQKKKLKVYNFWVRTGLDLLIQENILRKQDVLSNVCKIISGREFESL